MTDWALLEAARTYAERGWQVFPVHSIQHNRCTCGKSNCESPGKHPRTAHGFLDATLDDDQITAWWTEWPNANIGIRTGEKSRLGIVDIDPRNGGWESAKSLDLDPTTLIAQTGGGGLHYYHDLDRALKGHELAKGIDLQADGDYVVAPPSNHVLGQYAWVNEVTRLAPIPLWAMNGSAPKEGPIVVEPDQKTWVAEALTTACPKGGRHKTLAKLAGFFRNALSETVTRAILTEWNEDYCEPALSVAEVTKQVKDIYGRYAGSGDHPIDLWTVSSLLRAEFPPLTWIVEGLLPEGLVFLAGRPKRGKSWLALQIALDVVNARASLGPTTTGRVLYVALEDSPRRLQTRLQAMGATESDDLMFINELAPLDNGGYGRLVELMDEYHPVLVVVDTLARVMGRKRDQDSNSDMTDVLAPLQVLAGQRHCCILLVDHHRKPGAEVVDMIDDIAGSTAKTAVADAIIGLYRKSGEQSAQLKLTGRDVEEKELTLRWDSLKFHWCIEINAALTSSENQVVAFIREIKETKATTIASLLGVGLRNAQEILSDLVDKGVLTRQSIESGVRGRPTFLYKVGPG